MSYVLAVITSLTSSDAAITTAVDDAEIVNRKFMKDLNISNVTMGTEEMQQQKGGTRNVSTIDMKLCATENMSLRSTPALRTPISGSLVVWFRSIDLD